MTTEDDFQSALDANPDDWQTRLVFADWLQERDDPRAPGYRALGERQRRPQLYGTTANWPDGEWSWWTGLTPQFSADQSVHHRASLPKVWWNRLVEEKPEDSHRWDKNYPTRRAAEDAAAIAFTLIPDGVVV